MKRFDPRFLGLFRGSPVYQRATMAEVECAAELLSRAHVPGTPAIAMSRSYLKRWLDCGYELDELLGKVLVEGPVETAVRKEIGHVVLDEAAH